MDTVKIAEVLEFERIWWQRVGDKEEAVRKRFSLTPTRYYQLLNKVLETPEALATDAVTVHRLLRIRASNR